MNNKGMCRSEPSFLLIGAQKCGTSWLYKHLRRHPDIFMPEPKELEFFSYRNHLENPGFAKYLEHFSESGNASAIGEATASYFWTKTNSSWGLLPDGFQTDIPKVVHQHLDGQLKLIVTLRHPVKRVISAYLHYLVEGEVSPDMDFDRAMTYGGIIDMGFYASHLCNWLDYYPMEQIKVLILETDIEARPLQTLSEICNFLSVQQHSFDGESVQQAIFAGVQRKIDKNGVFVPVNSSLVEAKNGLYQDVAGRYWRQVISAEMLNQLHDIFLPDVKNLDSILGTKLVKTWNFSP